MTLFDPPPHHDRIAHGRVRCEGTGQRGELVSSSGRRRWWRCPVCRWCGWPTSSGRAPVIPFHARVEVDR